MRTYSQLGQSFGGRRSNSIYSPTGGLSAGGYTFYPGDLPETFSGLLKQKQAIQNVIEGAFRQHDYDSLFDDLEFLKFDRFNAEKIISIVSTAASCMTAIGAIVSLVETASKVLSYLGVGAAGFNEQQALVDIKKQIDEIYGFLEAEAINNMYKRAAHLRSDIQGINDTLKTASTSPSAVVLDELKDKAELLDDVINDMLTIEQGNIPFSRRLFSQTQSPNSIWFAVSGTPYLKHADGRPTPALTGIGARVWDPGYYIDLIAGAIRLRLLAATVLEPLYRSTGYHRADIESLVQRLAQAKGASARQ